MAILPGRRLGPYEILSPIGAGGMGEVYQAHDTKLGRDVAIKVLPANFTNDPERLSRFQREARMLAALNHPNIATIYGLEQSDNVACLVMELVPGETLAERVKAGPLPIEEALRISAQIAEALEAAHEKSIIHRDLKPANVKVTPQGKVKVLDFGLAKASADDAGIDDPSKSPTLSAAATMQGTILGTAAYMSPEQARGKACDKRTDIWAFGCVLYELLTGKQAFHGETTTEILAAVLRGEPDWQALPETTPLSIRALLRRCLQKEMSKRARDAGDARIEIEEALVAPVTAEQTTAAPTKGVRTLGRGAVVLSIGALLLTATITGLTVWILKPASPKPITRFAISLPAGQRLAALDQPAIALTPDGTRLIYVATQGGIAQVYVRAMDSPEAKPIPGTEGAVAPFFSPDGQWVGFFAGGALKKISVNGGAAVTLCFAGGGTVYNSASWGPDDTIVFNETNGGGLLSVSGAGGTPQQLIKPKPGEFFFEFPQMLPGGKAVLFAGGGSLANIQVGIHSQQTGERRDLVGGTRPSYAPTGHLVYAQAGTLMAVPFDPRRLIVSGSPVPVMEGVLQSQATGVAQYSFSSTGSVAYLTGSVPGARRKLVWVDRKGVEQPLSGETHVYRAPRLSPDGRRVAVAIADQGGGAGGAGDIWLYDLARETLSRLTFGGGNTPIWTPDSKRVAFQAPIGGTPTMFWQPADGSGGAERLAVNEYQQVDGSWSPDGQVLAFVEVNPTTGRDLWTMHVSSDGKPQLFLRTQFNETAPQFSPDGHWLSYASDESGRYEIYVQPFPGPGGKWQISTEGGTEPVWGHNGEIFYRSGNKMIAVETTTQPTFSVGKPKVLFAGQYVPSLLTMPNYDVSPNGQRFVMVKEDDQAAATTQINVVLNWFEELKQKVPTGKK